MAREWNKYQMAVFENVLNGTGHLVVSARAGVGKTTVVLESINHIPQGKSVLLCAFNNRIVAELEARAPKSVTVRTLHSLGFAALRASWGKHVRPVDRRDRDVLEKVTPYDLRQDHRMQIGKVIGFAKAHLATKPEEIISLAYRHGLMPDWDAYCDENWKPRYTDLHMTQWVQKALEIARTPSAEISFDDMVYAPAALQMRSGPYDYVFVDETQDMTASQLLLARLALSRTGRLIAVGDDRQAIYAFRGADSEAMPRIVREMNAKVLPLSVSYRCPRLVADIARQIVPDFETPESAPNGDVAPCSLDTLTSQWREGDFVLSRANAPLVPLCLAALRDGKRARVQGRDIGAGISALVRKSAAKTLERLTDWLADWETAECTKLVKAKREEEIDSVRDRADTIRALADGVGSIDGLLKRIEFLFSDDKSSPAIMFSSVHRAKGMESQRVWLLTGTFRVGTSDEEDNLWYVAVTRSQNVLRLVNHPERKAATR